MTFTKPSRFVNDVQVTPTQTVNVTTDAQGNWTATPQTSDRSDIGSWSVASRYAGNGPFATSSAAPCTFDVVLGTGTTGTTG